MRNRGAGERRGFRLRRCSALARRDDIPLCESVNCAPTKCCVWPVLAPAEGIVRAGAGLRGRWFCRGGLPRFTPDFAVLLECFAFGSRLSFFLCQEKRDGLRYLAFLFRGSRSPFVRSRGVVRLSAFVGLLRVCAFICGNLDGGAGDAENGVGGAALVRFCVGALALICFPRGVRWGCAPQTCAKESSTLWTLFTLRRGYVSADSRPYRKRQRPNHRTHACKTQVHGKT